MIAADGLSDYLQARRLEVEAALATVLSTTADFPAVVADAMRYSLTAGGKRLRPILCLASADAVGGDRAMAMPAACAIELIHTYSLIHDDLPAMDNDTMRRGRPTLHVVAGEGMAILAGDGLLTEAFALLAREPRGDVAGARRAQAAGDWRDRGCRGARGDGGRPGDRSRVRHGRSRPAADCRALDADGLRGMHARKTGALIRASAVAGAIMGGGSDRAVAAIDAAAADLGLAFQIVDDVLDVEGASRGPGQDRRQGRRRRASQPTRRLYGLERSRQMAAECLARAEAALNDAGLADSRLLEIGRWIVTRSS